MTDNKDAAATAAAKRAARREKLLARGADRLAQITGTPAPPTPPTPPAPAAEPKAATSVAAPSVKADALPSLAAARPTPDVQARFQKRTPAAAPIPRPWLLQHTLVMQLFIVAGIVGGLLAWPCKGQVECLRNLEAVPVGGDLSLTPWAFLCTCEAVLFGVLYASGQLRGLAALRVLLHGAVAWVFWLGVRSFIWD